MDPCGSAGRGEEQLKERGNRRNLELYGREGGRIGKSAKQKD